MNSRHLVGAVIVAMMVACGDGTGPASSSWAQGTWTAVLMNGAPLPCCGGAYPYVQSDSLTLVLIDPPYNGNAGAVFSDQRVVFSATSSTLLLCWDTDIQLTVTANGLSTRAKGATTTGGNCNPSFVAFDFTRVGDSLAGSWNGASVRLVKRP